MPANDMNTSPRPTTPEDPGTPAQSPPAMNPGDEAPEGTPGTGQRPCPQCGGRGYVIGGIGGA